MTDVLDQVLAANARCAADFGTRSELALPPARRFAILTCMGARSGHGRLVGWHTFTDLAASVTEDGARIPIHGRVRDVRTGRLSEGPEAAAIARAVPGHAASGART